MDDCVFGLVAAEECEASLRLVFWRSVMVASDVEYDANARNQLSQDVATTSYIYLSMPRPRPSRRSLGEQLQTLAGCAPAHGYNMTLKLANSEGKSQGSTKPSRGIRQRCDWHMGIVRSYGWVVEIDRPEGSSLNQRLTSASTQRTKNVYKVWEAPHARTCNSPRVAEDMISHILEVRRNTLLNGAAREFSSPGSKLKDEGLV